MKGFPCRFGLEPVLLCIAALNIGLRTADASDCDAAVQDQAQTEFTTWVDLRLGGSQRFVYAQTFSPEVTGYLCAVTVSACWGDNYPESPTSFTIVDTVDGLPGTNVLGRAALAHLDCNGQQVTSWNKRVFLRAGVLYALILDTDAPQSGARTYSFRSSHYNRYTRGMLWQRSPTNSWVLPIWYDSPTPHLDIIFVTYMLPFDPVIRLAAPSDGAQLRTGDNVLLAAELRSDVSGPVTAAFYRDLELIGTDNTPPFSVVWNPQSSGQFHLAAVLNGDSGPIATSEVVPVIVAAVGPPNDDFANRTRIENNYTASIFSNVDATLEPFEPRASPTSAGQTVWWEWRAQRTTPATVQVSGAQTNTLLAIYTGAYLETLVPVTNGLGRCLFAAQTGNTYHIVVDSVSSDLTNSELRLAQSDVEITSPPTRPLSQPPQT